MACGIPSIYSDCSGQLEFAEGRGIPVQIKGELPAKGANGLFSVDIPGNYYEPDFEDLSLKMRESYSNYEFHKKKALEDSIFIREKFDWKSVAEKAKKKIENFMERRKNLKEEKNRVIITYFEGPKVEILGEEKKSYLVEFIDQRTGETIYSSTIENNMWTKCSREYFIPWRIKINGEIIEDLNLEGKKVMISMESKCLGDTIAWVPYAVKFAEKNKCNVLLSTFHNYLFEKLKSYEDIEFISPGESIECSAVYRLGWFKKDGRWDNGVKNPRSANLIPLQQTATDILGLDFEETNYGIYVEDFYRPIEEDYVVFGPASTSGCKEWSIESWASLGKLISGLGYKVVVLTPHSYPIDGTINVCEKSLVEIIPYLYHAKAFVGLGSGLSWLNWALGKHTHMINGFSKHWHEFTARITRVSGSESCISCWNDEIFTFDPGDWNWCPVYKGTKKQHICQKSITPLQVFQSLLERI